MLIGVLIMFLMLSAITLTLINRAFQDAKIVTDSKKSYSAYQKSDTQTETLLTNIKSYDNTVSNQIPENTVALSTVCSGADRNCYKYDSVNGQTLIDSNDTLDQILNVEQSGTDPGNQTKRTINAPVPARVVLDRDSVDLRITQCGNGQSECKQNGGTGYNKCDVVVKWEATEWVDSDKIVGWEVRRSNQEFLIDTVYGWQRPPNTSPANPAGLAYNSESLYIENNCDASLGLGCDPKSGGQYGQKYFYTIKARNKRNFELDSLYYYTNVDGNGNKYVGDEQKIEVEAVDCDDDGGEILDELGCIDGSTASNTYGIVEATSGYNCCNGTKCYKPDPYSVKINEDEDCAVQKCGLDLPGYGTVGKVEDDVQSYPSGNQDIDGRTVLGWCATKTDCTQQATDCDNPRRKVGYCLTCKTGVYPAWTGENEQDIDMNDEVEKKYRCCSENCKTSTEIKADYPCGTNPTGGSYTNNSYCTKNTPSSTGKCGPRTDTKKCNLSCSGVYYLPNPRYNLSSSYPDGTCCYETCPSLSPTNGYSGEAKCAYTLPTNGTSWTNVSTCTSNKCATGTGAGQHGYTLTEKCNLNCKSGYYGSKPNSTFPNGTCCTQSCSGVTYSNWGNCYTHTCTENVCGDRTVVDVSWSLPDCTGSAPTCTCGYASGPTCTRSCGTSSSSASATWAYTCKSTYSCGSNCCNCNVCTGVCSQTMPTCPTKTCPSGQYMTGSCGSCTCSGCVDTRVCNNCVTGWDSFRCSRRASPAKCEDYGNSTDCGWTVSAWQSCATRCVDGIP